MGTQRPVPAYMWSLLGEHAIGSASCFVPMAVADAEVLA
jgi:hypothetical protein